MSVITLDEAKTHLRVDTADDNALITTLVSVAEDCVEKETKRTLLTQTFELVYDEVGASIEIIRSPLQEVTKIEVISEAGVKTEVSETLYDVDISGIRGRVRLRSGCSWPDHRGFASFIITAKAGYGDAAANVPSALKQAALIALAILYESRGEMDEAKISKAISGLCWPYKVFRL
jgi:uncharacterized phiE125 gp8 family phage protein